MKRSDWVNLNVCEETNWLLSKPWAFVLLAQIACRVQAKSLLQRSLGNGEALVGDYRSIGLTQGQYRQAKKVLQESGLVKFKGTTKGTVATLVDVTIFSPPLGDCGVAK